MSKLGWNDKWAIWITTAGEAGSDGVTATDATPSFKRLFEIVETLDKDLPKVLQKQNELEQNIEKLRGRLVEFNENLGRMNEKAVARDEIKGIIEETILDELEPKSKKGNTQMDT